MDLHLTEEPVATTGMLIRKPPRHVFEAFVNPDVTTRFWFTRSDGRLETGRPVTWYWDMYGASVRTTPKTVEPYSRLVVEWGGDGESSIVDWRFTAMPEDATFVEIRHTGFGGTADERVKKAIDSAQGFSFVLSGLKAFLEHGLELQLVRDRHPKGLASH